MIRPGEPPTEGPLLPTELRQLHPRLRVDRLRRYLRLGAVDRSAVARDLDAWTTLFVDSGEPALQVLILELVGELDDPRVVALGRRSAGCPGDGVRLEGLRILLDTRPDETPELVARHRDDPSLEVRLLLADRLLPRDRSGALELALQILRAEAGGPRELHALERVTELLVEGRCVEAAGALRALAAELDDPEGFLPWALEKLEAAGD
jgi:hypothetical protein